MRIKGIILVLFLVLSPSIFAQIRLNNEIEIDYATPKEYMIGGIKVEGTQFLDKDILIVLSGLRVGEKVNIPGESITKAIRNLWKQGLFGDVNIYIENIIGEKVFLIIKLDERPKVTRFAFSKNLKKGDVDDINDEIKKFKGSVYTENVRISCMNYIKSHYTAKAYWNVKAEFEELRDSTKENGVILKFKVEPGNKVKIGEIEINGNNELTDKQVIRTFKKTKPKQKFNIFRGAKFDETEFEEDKSKLIAKYRQLGYRDIQIVSDSIFLKTEDRFKIVINLDEGPKYYFRNISFKGNTIYSDSSLYKTIGLVKGDIYNQSILDQRLYMDPGGRDITSLYMDNGYLFFQLTPTEIPFENDSIDLIIDIQEGPQATINNVTIKGNEKTNDHVVLREIRTRPGMTFSRSDIIRTTRELSQLGYFDPEQINVQPTPNPQNGTVDLEYTVAERSNDQVELSGGWGSGRVVGSLGLTLNNFSARNAFNKSAWRPVPSGDGQRVSLRASSNGLFFQSYNASFTEPWIGGKKPNSFSVNLYNSVQSNGATKFVTTNGEKVANTNRQAIAIYGAGVSLGRRMKKPDDFFTMITSVNYQRYILNNYTTNAFLNNGVANNFFVKQVIGRNSLGDNPIFPTYGSSFTFSAQLTPPYSLFSKKDNSTLPADEKYKFVEYHKYKFDASWFVSIKPKLVLMAGVNYGFLGRYSSNTAEVPFGRFYVGGDGITGFNIDDRELIRLRGYKNNSIGPKSSSLPIGGSMYQKYTIEMRYAISLNPSATVYVLSFLEGGNNLARIKDFQPFYNNRSAGVGIRLFLPMFGLLGVDWGYGFDQLPNSPGSNKSNIHIAIGQTF